tara:strand:+ start:1143 stop:8447 length:7305 start_codon:yes stop_codon:yes gene_type:complete
MAIDSDNYEALLESLESSYNAPVGKKEATFGEKFKAGLRSGGVGLDAGMNYFDAAFQELTGDTYERDQAIYKAQRLEKVSAKYLEGLPEFEEFLDQPTAQGFVDQLAISTGEFFPSALASVGMALVGYLTGGTSFALMAGASRLALSSSAKKGARKIIKEGFEKRAKKLDTKTAAWEDMTEGGYTLLQTLRGAPGWQRSTRYGALGGAYSQEGMQGSGTTYGEFARQDMKGDREAAISMAVGFGPYAAVGLGSEVVGTSLVLKPFLKNLQKIAAKKAKTAPKGSGFASLAKELSAGFGKGATVGFAGGAASEGTAETLQQAMTAAQKFAIDEDYSTDMAKLDLVESAFKGFFGGGIIAGAGRGTTQAVSDAFMSIDSTLEKTKSLVEEASEELTIEKEESVGSADLRDFKKVEKFKQKQKGTKIPGTNVNTKSQEQDSNIPPKLENPPRGKDGINTNKLTEQAPESTGDLLAQLKTMASGKNPKKAVWISKNSPTLTQAQISEVLGGKEFFIGTVENEGTIVALDKATINEVIEDKASPESKAAALGYSEPKNATHDRAILIENTEGKEVHSETTNEFNAPAVKEKLQQAFKNEPDLKPPLELSLEEVLEERKERFIDEYDLQVAQTIEAFSESSPEDAARILERHSDNYDVLVQLRGLTPEGAFREEIDKRLKNILDVYYDELSKKQGIPKSEVPIKKVIKQVKKANEARRETLGRGQSKFAGETTEDLQTKVDTRPELEDIQTEVTDDELIEATAASEAISIKEQDKTVVIGQRNTRNKNAIGWLAYEHYFVEASPEKEAEIAEATRALYAQYDLDNDVEGKVKFQLEAYRNETLGFSFPASLLNTLTAVMKQNPSAEYEIVTRVRKEVSRKKYNEQAQNPFFDPLRFIHNNYELGKFMGMNLERMEFLIKSRRPLEETLINAAPEGQEEDLVTPKKFLIDAVARNVASLPKYTSKGFFVQRPQDKAPRPLNMPGLIWDAKKIVTAEGAYIEGDQKQSFRALEMVLGIGGEIGYEFFANVKRGKKIEVVSFSDMSQRDIRNSPAEFYKKGTFHMTLGKFMTRHARNAGRSYDDYAAATGMLISAIVDTQITERKAEAIREKIQEKESKGRAEAFKILGETSSAAYTTGSVDNAQVLVANYAEENKAESAAIEDRVRKEIEREIAIKVREDVELKDENFLVFTTESPVRQRRKNGQIQLIPATEFSTESTILLDDPSPVLRGQREVPVTLDTRTEEQKISRIKKPTVEQLTDKRRKKPLSKAYAEVKVKANEKRWNEKLPFDPSIMDTFDLIIDSLVKQGRDSNANMLPYQVSFEGRVVDEREPGSPDVVSATRDLLSREGAQDLEGQKYRAMNREQNDTKPPFYTSSNVRKGQNLIEMSSDFRRHYSTLANPLIKVLNKFKFFGISSNIHFITFNDLQYETADVKTLNNNTAMQKLLKQAYEKKSKFGRPDNQFRGGVTLRLPGRQNKDGSFTPNDEYVIVIDTDFHRGQHGAQRTKDLGQTADALITIAHELAHVIQLNYLDDVHFLPGVREKLKKEFFKAREANPEAYGEANPNAFEEWFADRTAEWLIGYASNGGGYAGTMTSKKWRKAKSAADGYFLRIAKDIIKAWDALIGTSTFTERVNLKNPNPVFDEWIKSITTAAKRTAGYERSEGQLTWDQKELVLEMVADNLKKVTDKKTYKALFKKTGNLVSGLLNDSPDAMEIFNRIVRTAPGMLRSVGLRELSFLLGGQAASTEAGTEGLSMRQESQQLNAQFQNGLARTIGLDPKKDRVRLTSLKLTREQEEAFFYAEDETISDKELSKLSPMGLKLRVYAHEFYVNHLAQINPKTGEPYLDIGLLQTNTRDGGIASYFTRSLLIRDLHFNPEKRALFEQYTVGLIESNNFLVQKVDLETKEVKFEKPKLVERYKDDKGVEKIRKITAEQYAERYVDSILRLDVRDSLFERIMSDSQKDEVLGNVNLGFKSSLSRSLAYRRIPDIEGVTDENGEVIIRDYGYPTTILRQLGLLEHPTTAFLGYGRHASKRLALEKIGGEKYLEEQIASVPTRKQPLVRKAIRSILGKVDSPMNPTFRQFNSWGLFSNIVTTLTFSVLASFPDLAGPFLRSRELSSFKTGLELLKDYATDPSKREEFIQFSLDIGATTQDAMADMLMNAAEMDYMTEFTKKGTDFFFRAILLDQFTNFTRVFAAGMGRRFIISLALNTKMDKPRKRRYLKQLGVTEQEVLTWLNEDKQDLNTPAGIKVSQAIYKFVDESIIRPNSAQRPMWASNPYFALVWQLKGFFYAYGKTIIGGQAREIYARYQEAGAGAAALPLVMMAMTIIPLTMLGLEIREYIKLAFGNILPGAEAFGEKDYLATNSMPWDTYIYEIFDRSGVAGPFGLLLPLVPGHQWGGPFEKGASIVGPTADKVFDIFKYGPVDARFWKEQVPLYGQVW